MRYGQGASGREMLPAACWTRGKQYCKIQSFRCTHTADKPCTPACLPISPVLQDILRPRKLPPLPLRSVRLLGRVMRRDCWPVCRRKIRDSNPVPIRVITTHVASVSVPVPVAAALWLPPVARIRTGPTSILLAGYRSIACLGCAVWSVRARTNLNLTPRPSD